MAQAADLPAYEPPPPMLAPEPLAYNWTGFYIGGHGGYAWGQGAFDDGVVAGGQIGANWQWDAFVLGAEFDGSWADLGAVDSLASVRLRGGFGFDRFLVYGTGGAGFADFDEVGWVAGGGAEFLLTNNISIGAEFLHYDFGGDDANVARGRLNFKFGG
jgi:outer membrane immunogenic protein